jgi:hypothetical protein
MYCFSFSVLCVAAVIVSECYLVLGFVFLYDVQHVCCYLVLIFCSALNIDLFVSFISSYFC